MPPPNLANGLLEASPATVETVAIEMERELADRLAPLCDSSEVFLLCSMYS